MEKDVQGKTPKEVAEDTTDKHSSKPEVRPLVKL